MSRWFRHYAGLVRDDKLVRAALRSKHSVERVVWVWCAILESAGEIDEKGRYELDRAECAYFLRVEESDIAAIEDALVALGRVERSDRQVTAEGSPAGVGSDRQVTVVAKWGKRQFQSDRSAERQKRHVTAKRASGDGLKPSFSTKPPSRDGEKDKNDGLKPSLPPSRDAPETETETETETEKKDAASRPASGHPALPSLEVELYARGKQILGQDAGGVITKVVKFKNGDRALALALLHTASTKQNPREYIGAILRGQVHGEPFYDPAI